MDWFKVYFIVISFASAITLLTISGQLTELLNKKSKSSELEMLFKIMNFANEVETKKGEKENETK